LKEVKIRKNSKEGKKHGEKDRLRKAIWDPNSRKFRNGRPGKGFTIAKLLESERLRQTILRVLESRAGEEEKKL